VFEKARRYVVSRLSQVVRSEEGATIIEYVLLAAVVVLGLLAIFGTLRTTLIGKIQEIIDGIDAAPGP
jgi:Flp pilus assembly pilin Flp